MHSVAGMRPYPAHAIGHENADAFRSPAGKLLQTGHRRAQSVVPTPTSRSLGRSSHFVPNSPFSIFAHRSN